MKTYLAILDHYHLDNGVFLNAFAQACSSHQDLRLIIIHGDSAYTDRIMQTGVMREEAEKRSIRDLNNRLVALLADHGVSALGLSGYQRNLITEDEAGSVSVDARYLTSLPANVTLLISNLSKKFRDDDEIYAPIPLKKLAYTFEEALNLAGIVGFSIKDRLDFLENEEKKESTNWNELSEEIFSNYLPEELHNFNKSLYLTNAKNFADLPSMGAFLEIDA